MQIVAVEILSNVRKVISVKCVNKVHNHVLMNAVFSIIHFLHDTVFKRFFLGHSSIDMSETSHTMVIVFYR